jgi:hypothetical protein
MGEQSLAGWRAEGEAGLRLARLARAAEAVSVLGDERDRLIRELYAQGWTLRDLAGLSRLSHQRVHQIVRKGEE